MATFSDTFTRADSTTVGGGWGEIELAAADAAIASNYLQFGSNTNAAAIYQARQTGFGRSNTTAQFVWRQSSSGTTSTEASSFCISHDGGTRGGSGIRIDIARTGTNNVVIRDQSGTALASATVTLSVNTDYYFRWDIASDYSMKLYKRAANFNFIPTDLILSVAAFTPEAADQASWGFAGRFFGLFKSLTIYDAVQPSPGLVSPVTASSAITSPAFILKILPNTISAIESVGAAVFSAVSNGITNVQKHLSSWLNFPKS